MAVAVGSGAGGVWVVTAVFCGAAVQAVRNRAVIKANKNARGRGALLCSAFAHVGVRTEPNAFAIGQSMHEIKGIQDTAHWAILL